MKAGKKQLAIDNYKKSLELNPADDDAKPAPATLGFQSLFVVQLALLLVGEVKPARVCSVRALTQLAFLVIKFTPTSDDRSCL